MTLRVNFRNENADVGARGRSGGSHGRRWFPWGGKMAYNIVDRSMIKSEDSGDKPALRQGRFLKFMNELKHFMQYDPNDAHAVMSGEMTYEELMNASVESQNCHKFNVLGCGYRRLSDKYNRGEELGHGGFAKVYKVTDIHTGKSYACKEIAKKKLFKQGVKHLLVTEIKAMQKLAGADNVLEICDVLEDPSHLFMMLELCHGKDVMSSLSQQHIDKGTYTEAHAASLIRMMTSAVNSCHASGVLHRDIKPENFLWTEEGGKGTLKLADYGLAAIQQSKQETFDDMVGTAPYMAPEVWKKNAYATSPDIWALGITMAVLLTGEAPFDGNNPSELASAVCDMVLNMDEAPWRHLSEEARDLISRFLEKDPTKRITIEEALHHPWLNGAAPATSLSSNALSGVEKITHMNQLHQAILTLLAKAAVEGTRDPDSKSLRQKLVQCDTNGDGQISVDDLRAALEGSDYNVTDKEADQILASLDTDRDGKLSYEQFLASEIHLRAQRAEDDTGPATKAFEMLDRDGNGEVSLLELCQVLKDASIPITKEVTDSFWELDADGNGNVSLDTLMSFWKHNVHAEPVSSHSRSPSDERLHNSIHKSAISMVRYSYAKSIAGTRS